MFLTDIEIKSRLADLAISSPDASMPFNEDLQVKPCSVDLRLSPTYWQPRRFRSLDLSLKQPWGAKIAQAFKQRSIPDDGIVLRPGQFILGRTFETFKIPPDLLGQLTGRSSIGRLGVSVVATSGLINPGWRGHMPLMLINHSPYSVRHYAGLSVVQVYFSPLRTPPEKLYGEESGAKYANDDGGPSKYWLDWSMKLLRERVDAKVATPLQTEHLARVSAALDEPTRQRFSKALVSYGTVSDTSDFIEYFARRERERSARLTVAPWLLSLPTAALYRWGPALWNVPGWTGKASLAVGIVATLFAAYRLYRLNQRTAFSANDIRKIAKEQERQ